MDQLELLLSKLITFFFIRREFDIPPKQQRQLVHTGLLKPQHKFELI